LTALRKALLAALGPLGIEEVVPPGRDDGFAGLLYRGRELGHFHDDHEVDLKLGKKLIASEKLSHRPDSRVHPNRAKGSSFIELPLRTRADLERIVKLVRVVIDAS
jgi:hypothetical protein